MITNRVIIDQTIHLIFCFVLNVIFQKDKLVPLSIIGSKTCNEHNIMNGRIGIMNLVVDRIGGRPIRLQVKHRSRVSIRDDATAGALRTASTSDYYLGVDSTGGTVDILG